MYRSIKQLLDANIIKEVGERRDPALDNERRRYYDLTDFGLQVLNAEKQRQQNWVGLTQHALNRRMAAIADLQACEEQDPDTLEIYDP
jgi:hypothetical protein